MTPSSAHAAPSSYSAGVLCRIVGLACIVGFAVDLLILGSPPSFGNPEWRIGLLRQLSDRSIVLLFGGALLTYGCLDSRNLRKQLALVCLVLGIALQLACIAVIRDSLQLNELAAKTISSQAAQIQTQIQNQKSAPNPAIKASLEQLEQTAKMVDSRAVSLKETAKTGILRTAIATVGNLVVTGIALICLGRYGLRLRRS